MVIRTLPTLIRYGKYKIPYKDNTPLPPSLSKKEFNKQMFYIGSGIASFIGINYAFLYYKYKNKK
jgi:hypothetical protein